MDAEWKRKWVEALRSGEYKQGRGELRSRKDEFCCLGVLCDVVAKEGGGAWGHALPACSFSWSFDESHAVLGKNVQKLVGLPNHNPMVGFKSLAQCNDHGLSFVQIADLIEKHL